MKKWGRLLAVTGIVAAAVLVGCSEKGLQNETASMTEQSSVSNGEAGGTITFTFAEHVANIEEQAPQVYAVVQAYMKLHPNVTIELTGASADDLTRNLQMAAQSNTLPDLFWVRQPVAVEMAQAGYLADLTEDILSDQDLVDSFLPHVLDSLTIDGKLYGIPCELQCNGFWINKAILDQYDLEIPVTYEEFLACCQTLKRKRCDSGGAGSQGTIYCVGLGECALPLWIL